MTRDAPTIDHGASNMGAPAHPDSSRPAISVVIASLVGPPFLDACIESVYDEAVAVGAQLVVVIGGADRDDVDLQRRFPGIDLERRPTRETIPQLRRRGVERARGAIVAVIEEHCAATAGWLREIARALEDPGYGVVGGPVVDANYRRLRDWVVYFCEYNGALPPAPDGEVAELNGANIAYRRQLLETHLERLGEGYWEASLHPDLQAAGVRFGSIPTMRVQHRGPFDLGYYLRQRYWFSRAYAGARARTISRAHRAAYLLAAPMVPPLLLARMGSRILAKRCRVGRFLQALPLITCALVVLVVGEWIGYARGPGDALGKVE